MKELVMRSYLGPALLAAALASTINVADAQQHVGPFQRDYRGQNCPPNSIYQNGSCLSANPATGRRTPDPYETGRSTPESNDWRRQRERELEDESRTSYDRDHDRDNWRIQRQRELDDRFGKAVPSKSQEPKDSKEDGQSPDRRNASSPVGPASVSRLDNKPPKPEDCVIRPPGPGTIETPRAKGCGGAR
jgi:hypothetical protein